MRGGEEHDTSFMAMKEEMQQQRGNPSILHYGSKKGNGKEKEKK